MNKIIIAGYIGQDCKVNNVSGKLVGNISVAVTKRLKEGNQTTWFDVNIWERDNLYPYLKKGTFVTIDGEVSLNVYNRADGTQGASLKVFAHNVHLYKSAENNVTNAATPASTTASVSEVSTIQDTVDDLPF